MALWGVRTVKASWWAHSARTISDFGRPFLKQTRAVWGGRADQIELGPNETLTLDPIVIQSESDAFALHRSYAQQVADHQSVTMD